MSETATPSSEPRTARINLLRVLGPHSHARVGFIELFFDLIFVFAVTQLSHHLIEHFTPLGAFQTLILFLAVWWAWIDTAWVTNWLDPEKWPVRLMLLALMLAGLVLSTSIPDAFGERGLYFAIAYAFIQVGRAVFTLWALRGHSPANYRNFQRITVWFILFSAIWVVGGLVEGEMRLILWTIAVIIETAAPSHGFYVPGLARSTTADWDVEGSHMAERCGLFIIIALGESILVTGATFAGLEWDAANVSAFAVAFLGSRGDVVDLFRHRPRTRQPAHRKGQPIPAGSRGSPTPISISPSSRASSSWRSATNWCSPIPRATPTPGWSPRSPAGRRSISSAPPSSSDRSHATGRGPISPGCWR